mgnify:CR=1 FL=1
MLYARIGKTYSPISGDLVKKHTVRDVLHFVKEFEENTKLFTASETRSTKLREELKFGELVEEFNEQFMEEKITKDSLEDDNISLVLNYMMENRINVNVRQVNGENLTLNTF